VFGELRECGEVLFDTWCEFVCVVFVMIVVYEVVIVNWFGEME